MIVTTLGQLTAAEVVLKRLLEVRLSAGHATTVYRLGKLARKVATETKHWRDQHAAFVQELGTERDATPQEQLLHGPKVTTVTPENLPAFIARMEDLSRVEVQIDVAPLAPAMWDLFELSAADLEALQPLVGEWPD